MEAEHLQSATIRGATDRALAAAIEIYARWQAERDRTPLDRCVDSEFRARRYLNAGERRWIAEVLYSSVRFLRRQTFLLERLGLEDTPENRIRLRASESGVSAFRHTPPPVSSEALQAALDVLPGPDAPQDFLRITLSFPDAMAAELEALLGDEAIAAAEGLNQQAPVTLRVNTLRTTREKARAALGEAVPTHFSPWGLELPRRVNLPSLPGFRDGWFEMQEEASQLAVLATDARPGQTVLEVGAGAGGKTLALAAMMQNKGRLFALDTSQTRLAELQKRASRAGARGIIACPIETAADGIWTPSAALNRIQEQLGDGADCVLLDAPCTGSGVLRRSPDTKWRPVDRAAFTRLQQNLLAQSAALVKPGGSLLYVTCAFERWQNEEIVAAFLNSEAGVAFELQPLAPRLTSALDRLARTSNLPDITPLTDGFYFRSWPHRHNLDAFFAASLRRTANDA